MRGYAAVGLYRPTREVNIGGVMRAAYCLNASLVVIDGKFHKQSSDTPSTYRHIPVVETNDIMESIPYDCIPIAVELSEKSVSLFNFVHPERAIYIFGPENGSLPQRIMDRCKITLKVPTRTCLNLAGTANIVLYDRVAKGYNRAGGTDADIRSIRQPD